MRRVRQGIVVWLALTLWRSSSLAEIGIWTSRAELLPKPMQGPAWDAVVEAADRADPNEATVSDQDSNNNAEILAAAIVYARTGDSRYKDKVIAACEKLIAGGEPPGRTLAWARETGAYAMAADLVDYRTTRFEIWLRNMAEVFVGEDNRTILSMFKQRPNNWGSHGFGCLCAIYRYLDDTARLEEIRKYWIRGVLGPNPGYKYGSDLSWHLDPQNPRLINPRGALKEGMNVDGIIPDDMRRGGPFQVPPRHTGYPWEFLQGQVMAARILERAGMPIWEVGDSAIYRAAYALQVRLEHDFGGWKAEGDDLWMLPFLDQAYGTNWTKGQPSRVWKHGKNTGWPYVVIEGPSLVREDGHSGPRPVAFQLLPNHPNPFSASTVIGYVLRRSAGVRLTVYDATGRRVSTLVCGMREPGSYRVPWRPVDAAGRRLPPGVYLCQLQADEGVKTIKMLVVR